MKSSIKRIVPALALSLICTQSLAEEWNGTAKDFKSISECISTGGRVHRYHGGSRGKEVTTQVLSCTNKQVATPVCFTVASQSDEYGQYKELTQITKFKVDGVVMLFSGPAKVDKAWFRDQYLTERTLDVFMIEDREYIVRSAVGRFTPDTLQVSLEYSYSRDFLNRYSPDKWPGREVLKQYNDRVYDFECSEIARYSPSIVTE